MPGRILHPQFTSVAAAVKNARSASGRLPPRGMHCSASTSITSDLTFVGTEWRHHFSTRTIGRKYSQSR